MSTSAGGCRREDRERKGRKQQRNALQGGVGSDLCPSSDGYKSNLDLYPSSMDTSIHLPVVPVEDPTPGRLDLCRGRASVLNYPSAPKLFTHPCISQQAGVPSPWGSSSGSLELWGVLACSSISPDQWKMHMEEGISSCQEPGLKYSGLLDP